VRFLRGLLFDGELSGEEVWCLANFLNKQPREICGEWPANVLIPLMQNVFADGELTELEMVRVATALLQIEKEWIRRFAATEWIEEGGGLPASPRRGFGSGTKPLLPTVNYVTNVASSSDNGEYQVDLERHTCTCGDWVGMRRTAPAGDYKRLCKHMAGLYYALEIPDEIEDEMFGAFIMDHAGRERGTFPQDEWIVETVNGKKVLYGFSDRPWVNVFAPQGGAYERFGFNKEERRWSYGESPRGFARFFKEKF